MRVILCRHALLRDTLTIGKQCHLSEDAQRLLRPDLSPDDFLDTLLASHLYRERYPFPGASMPKQRAVWWGCLCAWLAVRPTLPDKAQAALQAAVNWMLRPSESSRRAAEEAGRADNFETAPGCLAMAAFWSSGSCQATPKLTPLGDTKTDPLLDTC